MRGRLGGEVRALLFCCALFITATPAFAEALDPNGGYIWIGDSIGFNTDAEEMIFDQSVGSLGSLVPVVGADDSGFVSSSNPNYTGNYSFDLQITVPLDTDWSWMMPGTAWATFDCDGLPYALIDTENSDSVLLSGELVGTFDLFEQFSNKLFPISGSGVTGLVGMTITGGTLEPYFAPEAEMLLEYWIASPGDPLFVDFSTSLLADGGGSVIIYGVPEPATWLILTAGMAAGAFRRRKARQ